MSDNKPRRQARKYDLTKAPTLQHYFNDTTSQYCAAMSHVGSGKTSAMCVKAHKIAATQHPDTEGVRYTSHLFGRGSHSQLLRGTVKSFEAWIDPQLCQIRKSPPMSGTIEYQPLNDQRNRFPKYMFREGQVFPYKIGTQWDSDLETYVGGEDVSGMEIGEYFPKGTFVHANFEFVSLDHPEWRGDITGTEYTCSYLDEPDLMSNCAEVVPELGSRMGRYPPPDIAPITCSQVNMSYNPPPKGHFLEQFFAPENEELGRKLYRMNPVFKVRVDPEDPENFMKAEFYRNPDAEGVDYQALGYKYWEKEIDTNRHDSNAIRRRVLGEYTHGSGGALIHPLFNRAKHVVPPFEPLRSYKLIASLDWGNWGACLIGQFVDGKIQISQEIGAEDEMAHEFVRDTILPALGTQYAGYSTIVTGDPTGSYRRDVGEGPFSLFSDAGYIVEDETSLEPEQRWSAVNHFLKQNALEISEQCAMLIAGFEGEYTFKKTHAGTIIRQADKRKHHSAFMDCLQAICLLAYDGYEPRATASNSSHYYRETDNLKGQQKPFLWI